MNADQEFVRWLTARNPVVAEMMALQAKTSAWRRRGLVVPILNRKVAGSPPTRMCGPVDAPWPIRLRHEMGHAVVAAVWGQGVKLIDATAEDPHVDFDWRPNVSPEVILAALAGGGVAERGVGLRAGQYHHAFAVYGGDATDMQAASDYLGEPVSYTHPKWKRAEALAKETLEADREFLLDAEDKVRRAGLIMAGKEFHDDVARLHGYRFDAHEAARSARGPLALLA